MSAILESTPEQLAARLLAEGSGRAFFRWDSDQQRVVASAPWLEDAAAELESGNHGYRQHEAVFLAVGPRTGSLFGAFLHNTSRGQGQGGLRLWSYAKTQDFLWDGLRLSLGMGRKCALAGVWWGGGKGVIAKMPGAPYRDASYRRNLYREFGEFVTSLRGAYVTAEDVGTSPQDMAEVFQTTRFVTCVPPELGGSGNPSLATAAGVVCAMEAAIDWNGAGDLQGKRIAMQGCGNVGSAMIEELLARRVEHIRIAEISSEMRGALLDRFGGEPVDVQLVRPGDLDILGSDCDVLVPNALGGVLNPKTIPSLQTPIVCGAANNQLADDERDAAAIAARGILFVPDFLCNRMGIVQCGNEQYGHVHDDPAVERHLGRVWEGSIFCTTQRVLTRAREEGVTPVTAANRVADERVQESHPIWGHRARAIIDSLVSEGWDR